MNHNIHECDGCWGLHMHLRPDERCSALQAMTSETQQMLSRAWRCGGRRDVYSDFNDLTLRITVGALFGATVDSQQARRVAGEPLPLLAALQLQGHAAAL